MYRNQRRYPSYKKHRHDTFWELNRLVSPAHLTPSQIFIDSVVQRVIIVIVIITGSSGCVGLLP